MTVALGLRVVVRSEEELVAPPLTTVASIASDSWISSSSQASSFSKWWTNRAIKSGLFPFSFKPLVRNSCFSCSTDRLLTPFESSLLSSFMLFKLTIFVFKSRLSLYTHVVRFDGLNLHGGHEHGSRAVCRFHTPAETFLRSPCSWYRDWVPTIGAISGIDFRSVYIICWFPAEVRRWYSSVCSVPSPMNVLFVFNAVFCSILWSNFLSHFNQFWFTSSSPFLVRSRVNFI